VPRGPLGSGSDSDSDDDHDATVPPVYPVAGPRAAC
jgi:hypothetical protein